MRKFTRNEAKILLVVAVAVNLPLTGLVVFLETNVNRPICQPYPEADLTARVQTSAVNEEIFYTYLSKNQPPIISRTPLNLTEPEYYLVPVIGGGFTDICIKTTK